MVTNDEMLRMFDDLDAINHEVTKESILRAPFPYPGGKSRSVKYILEYLPHSKIYVEPFGGSAAVMLSKPRCELDVFNDRYSGVVSFYRCMRNKEKVDRLMEMIDLSIHSREDFIKFRNTWEDVNDDVDRAFRWYYTMSYSFGSLGRNFGRSTNSNSMAGKIRNNLYLFPKIHERFKKIQVENQDWHNCMVDYDGPDTVFYVDPPYIDGDQHIYKNTMKRDEHYKLLDVIFNLEGFVAVSGYSNPIYENQKWDYRREWNSFVSIQSMAYAEGNNKKELKGLEKRRSAKEVLWIKDAK